MSDAASGGAKSTKKISNEKGDFNEGHNKNRNGCRQNRSGNRYIRAKFKWKIEGLSILEAKEDKHTDSLMAFQK